MMRNKKRKYIPKYADGKNIFLKYVAPSVMGAAALGGASYGIYDKYQDIQDAKKLADIYNQPWAKPWGAGGNPESNIADSVASNRASFTRDSVGANEFMRSGVISGGRTPRNIDSLNRTPIGTIYEHSGGQRGQNNLSLEEQHLLEQRGYGFNGEDGIRRPTTDKSQLLHRPGYRSPGWENSQYGGRGGLRIMPGGIIQNARGVSPNFRNEDLPRPPRDNRRFPVRDTGFVANGEYLPITGANQAIHTQTEPMRFGRDSNIPGRQLYPPLDPSGQIIQPPTNEEMVDLPSEDVLEFAGKEGSVHHYKTVHRPARRVTKQSQIGRLKPVSRKADGGYVPSYEDGSDDDLALKAGIGAGAGVGAIGIGIGTGLGRRRFVRNRNARIGAEQQRLEREYIDNLNNDIEVRHIGDGQNKREQYYENAGEIVPARDIPITRVMQPIGYRQRNQRPWNGDNFDLDNLSNGRPSINGHNLRYWGPQQLDTNRLVNRPNRLPGEIRPTRRSTPLRNQPQPEISTDAFTPQSPFANQYFSINTQGAERNINSSLHQDRRALGIQNPASRQSFYPGANEEGLRLPSDMNQYHATYNYPGRGLSSHLPLENSPVFETIPVSAYGSQIQRYDDGGSTGMDSGSANQVSGGGASGGGGGDYDMGQWKENEAGGKGGDSGDSTGGEGAANVSESTNSNIPASSNAPSTPGPNGQDNTQDNTPNVGGDNGLSPNQYQDGPDPNTKSDNNDYTESLGVNADNKTADSLSGPRDSGYNNGGEGMQSRANQIGNGKGAAMDFYDNNEALINIIGPLAASFIPGVGPLISSAWIGAQGAANHNPTQMITSALFLPGNIAGAANAAKAATTAKAAGEAGAAAGTASAGGAASAEAAGSTAGQNALSGAAQTTTQAAQQTQAASTAMNNLDTLGRWGRRAGTTIQYGDMAYQHTQDQPAGYADGGRVPRYEWGKKAKIGAGVASGLSGLAGGLIALRAATYDPMTSGFIPGTAPSPDAAPRYPIIEESSSEPSSAEEYDWDELAAQANPRGFNWRDELAGKRFLPVSSSDDEGFAFGGRVRRYGMGGYAALVANTQRSMTTIGRANAINHGDYQKQYRPISDSEYDQQVRKMKEQMEQDED